MRERVNPSSRRNNRALPRNDSLRPLPVSVIEASDPFLWNMSVVSRMVDYVVQHCRSKYQVNIRWNLQDYTSFSADTDSVNINYAHLNKALEYQLFFFTRYMEIIGYERVATNQPIDQLIFDAAVLSLYEEYLFVYYTPYLQYELAVAIALFAVYAYETGFSDALYHAVPTIISKTRALVINSAKYHSQNLLNIP